MAEDLGDKTEAPTPRKLSKAREDGNVAKSVELVSALDLVVAFALIWYFGSLCVELFAEMLRAHLRPVDMLTLTRPGELASGMVEAFKQTFPILAVALGVLALVSGLGHLAQVQFLFSTKPVEPNIERISPLSGFQRIFGAKNLFRQGLNIIKLALIAVVAVTAASVYFQDFAGLALLDAGDAMRSMVLLIIKIAAWVLAILLILGVADYALQRFQHTRDLRMTKHEIKEEGKDTDGDPEIKARVRKMGRDIAMGQLRREVPKADVIVTNPTHFAVALRYDEGAMAAPVVVAKGADFMAFRIREIAIGSRVPIVEKPELARALYAEAKVGRAIDVKFYQAVAELLAYVYRLKQPAA
jgi:flagellar biosynthetic protein FlhB